MENLITFACNDVYLPHFNNLSRTQIYYGGSASGKSVFLAQRCVFDMMRGGRNYLICRKVGRTIRGSVFTGICRTIAECGLSELFDINKSDMLITTSKGYQIIFVGLDDVEKLKSLTPFKGAITDIWVEEATECEKNDIKQLIKRQRGGDANVPKRLVMSFNPILQSHWICTEYFKGIGWVDGQTQYNGDDLSIIKTTYKDNHFLTPDDIKGLENETDKYYYNVYTLGNWGILGHVIFTNWQVMDLSGMRDQFTNRRNGLDFGFSADPAALSIMHYDRMRKTVYIYDELYETGLTNDILAERLRDKIGDGYVKCDSAEPKSIAELQNLGITADAAAKGMDSVAHGIQWLQQQTIIIDAHCINAQNEFSTYHWKEDAGGNAMPIPVDKLNHLIDATRYGLEDDMENTWTMVSRRY
jgi:phage terminase large subunit